METIYIIQDFEDKISIKLESHNNINSAKRAMFILIAHELNNNRAPKFRTIPTIDLGTTNYQDYSLPRWANELLEEYFK